MSCRIHSARARLPRDKPAAGAGAFWPPGGGGCSIRLDGEESPRRVGRVVRWGLRAGAERESLLERSLRRHHHWGSSGMPVLHLGGGAGIGRSGGRWTSWRLLRTAGAASRHHHGHSPEAGHIRRGAGRSRSSRSPQGGQGCGRKMSSASRNSSRRPVRSIPCGGGGGISVART